MKKNSDFKNISYSNYEFISIFIILLFCCLLSNIPRNILQTCGCASVIGIILICIIVYFMYKGLTKYIFKYEYDIFEMIKKTYPKVIQKIIGIILYIFCMFFVYILISNIVFDLKATTYTLSSVFGLAIYFIIACFLFTRQGFNSIFRIAGYISGLLVLYIVLLTFMSVPFISISNFFPILGNGINLVSFDNFKNINIFAPLFFILFFGVTIKKEKRENIKNFNKLFIFVAIPLIMTMIMFVGTMPTELLNTRFTLFFDISRIVTFSTTAVKIAPFMIFIFSMITFIASSFVLLIACMSLQRCGVIKDYTKILIFSNIILAAIMLLPQSLINYNIIQNIFNNFALILCFAFPLLTIFIHNIRFNGLEKKFNFANHEVKNYE
ncbi:MAG: hypothetical protein RSB76_02515 [Clostridia bacterium]